MWSYYGSKSKLIHLYPKPINNKIIEPFAGTARYSLKYFENDVFIVDSYPIVIEIWKYLQSCSPGDIIGLPNMKEGDKLTNFNLSREEKLFLGMMIGVSSTSPRNTCSKFASIHNGYKNRYLKIANNLFKIRHWNFECKSYLDISNQKATWFIDPPYQYGGHKYVHSSKNIDFKLLSDYCKERQGQVIVCETMRADWLPFVPLISHKSANNINQTEAIWTNYHTHFNNVQQSIF